MLVAPSSKYGVSAQGTTIPGKDSTALSTLKVATLFGNWYFDHAPNSSLPSKYYRAIIVKSHQLPTCISKQWINLKFAWKLNHFNLPFASWYSPKIGE